MTRFEQILYPQGDIDHRDEVLEMAKRFHNERQNVLSVTISGNKYWLEVSYPVVFKPDYTRPSEITGSEWKLIYNYLTEKVPLQ